MNEENIWNYLKDSWPVLTLGVFGGFVSIISGEKRITVRVFFGGLLLSAFVALMVDAFLCKAGADQNTIVLAVAMSSFCSREIIEIAKRAYLSKVKKQLGSKDVTPPSDK